MLKSFRLEKIIRYLREREAKQRERDFQLKVAITREMLKTHVPEHYTFDGGERPRF